MKYIILLRGINISGKNKIPMKELKSELEAVNYKNVITYLNSGNIILESENSKDCIRQSITEIINTKFTLNIPVFIISCDEFKDLCSNLPDFSLNDSKEFYNNVIFTADTISPADVINVIGIPKDDIDIIKEYGNVIYWSYDLKRYQKSVWWKKTANSEIKDMITIRTVNTVRKILELCEK